LVVVWAVSIGRAASVAGLPAFPAAGLPIGRRRLFRSPVSGLVESADLGSGQVESVRVVPRPCPEWGCLAWAVPEVVGPASATQPRNRSRSPGSVAVAGSVAGIVRAWAAVGLAVVGLAAVAAIVPGLVATALSRSPVKSVAAAPEAGDPAVAAGSAAGIVRA